MSTRRKFFSEHLEASCDQAMLWPQSLLSVSMAEFAQAAFPEPEGCPYPCLRSPPLAALLAPIVP